MFFRSSLQSRVPRCVSAVGGVSRGLEGARGRGRRSHRRLGQRHQPVDAGRLPVALPVPCSACWEGVEHLHLYSWILGFFWWCFLQYFLFLHVILISMWCLCSCQVVVYPGKRKVEDLIKFLDKEMKKAKKERVKVNYLLHYSARHDCSGFMLFFCVCAAFFPPLL